MDRRFEAKKMYSSEQSDATREYLQPYANAPLKWRGDSKRALDLLFSGFGLVVLAPLLLVIALLIRFDSAGPALFRQTRKGLNGKPFRIYKFRTMRVQEDGPVVRQATRNDTRVTRLGRWLRRTSIDELPQLINVLRGEMSLVGPRPHALAHDDYYAQEIPTYTARFAVRPGITGLAQVNGARGETPRIPDMEHRVALDLVYIQNASVWLDLKILVRTVLVETTSRTNVF
jgi:exopolysaccharide biosynthesis polyprenyl glycosylphosphotransferase